jgi:hypothetical protein
MFGRCRRIQNMKDFLDDPRCDENDAVEAHERIEKKSVLVRERKQKLQWKRMWLSRGSRCGRTPRFRSVGGRVREKMR